jgi:hypothetical protein
MRCCLRYRCWCHCRGLLRTQIQSNSKQPPHQEGDEDAEGQPEEYEATQPLARGAALADDDRHRADRRRWGQERRQDRR